MEVIFPQANDFGKVIEIVEKKEENLDVKEIMQIISVGSDRQAYYYLNACKYLGIVDETYSFTEFGIYLRKCPINRRNLELCKKIVSKPVFGEVFFDMYFNEYPPNTEQIEQLILLLTNIKKLSVAKRRSSTVLNWIKWINKQKNC